MDTSKDGEIMRKTRKKINAPVEAREPSPFLEDEEASGRALI